MGKKRIVLLCVWKSCCGLTHCLNVLLAIVAIFLTGLVLLNAVQKEIPLPDKLISWVAQKALGEGYGTYWQKAVFDLRGGLLLEELTVFRKINNETLLDARTLHLDVSLSHLLLGMDPILTEIDGNGIRIFTPSSLSPAGLNEPVIEIHRAHVFEKDGQVVLHNLFMESMGIRIYATGSAPLSALLGTPEKEADEPSFISDLNAFIANLRRLPGSLNADCRLKWTMLPNRTHQLSLQAVSGSIAYKGTQLSRLSVNAEADFDGKMLHIYQFDGAATLSEFDRKYLPKFLANQSPELPVNIGFSASGEPAVRNWLSYPHKVSLHFQNPLPGFFPADLILIQTSLASEDMFLNFIIKGKDIFASGTAAPMRENETADDSQLPFQARFEAEFLSPKLHHFFPNLPEDRLLEDTQAAFLRVSASSKPAILDGFEGLLVCDDLFIGQTLFSNVRADFSVDSSILDLSDIHIQKAHDEAAVGSYFQDLKSSRFSLNAKGSAFPDSLDLILGNWWTQIFTHISASRPLPADVTVWGHWRQAEALQSVTAVSGSGASYRGMPIPEIAVRVRSNRDWAYLEQMEAHFEDGSVRGRIGWQQGIEDGALRPMVLEFKSDARWEAVVAASGIPELGEMTFEGNPRVEAKGIIWQEKGSGERIIPELKISLSNPGRGSHIAGLNQTGISVSGEVTPARIHLDRVSGTFAEGVFAGRVDIEDWMTPELRRRHLNIQVFDANYSESLYQLSGLMENPAALRESLLQDAEGGRIDAGIDLVVAPELAAWAGSGSINLREANVGKIHLFGGLSRFLDGLGLGFSSLDLNAASITWSLENSLLSLNEGLITGPVLKLQVEGGIDLEEKQLKLQVDAKFFKGLVSKLLTPVSDNLLFDVGGTIADPIWKLRLNPFRWFKNRMTTED